MLSQAVAGVLFQTKIRRSSLILVSLGGGEFVLFVCPGMGNRTSTKKSPLSPSDEMCFRASIALLWKNGGGKYFESTVLFCGIFIGRVTTDSFCDQVVA